MTEREQEATRLLEKGAERKRKEIIGLYEIDYHNDEHEVADEWVSDIVGTVIEYGREEPNGLPETIAVSEWSVRFDEGYCEVIMGVSENTIYVECYEDTVEPSDPKTYVMETSAELGEIIDWLCGWFN